MYKKEQIKCKTTVKLTVKGAKSYESADEHSKSVSKTLTKVALTFTSDGYEEFEEKLREIKR